MIMRKIFILLTALCLSVVSFAQNATYPLDTIDGKVYYKYAVQKSEGLYRISKNFNVSQEELVNCNPELKSSGLKLGQVILIPYVEQIDSSQYIVHELQPKETLYGLSKKYGVKIADIQKLNPKTSLSMGIGERLLIPDKDQSVATAAQPVEQATAPSQSDAPVPSATVVTDSVAVSEAQPAAVIVATDTLQATADSLTTDTLSPTANLPIRIAYCLPFMTNLKKRDAATDRFVEFYQGALLAIDEAQSNGQRFEIYAYDTEKGETRIQHILTEPALRNCDVIIGPAYPSQIAYASAYAFENQIPVIIPFSDKVADLDRNPYLLRFNSSDQQKAQALCQYIHQQEGTPNCLLLNIDNATTSSMVSTLLEVMEAERIAYTQLVEPQLNADSLARFLSKSQSNIIIFNTDRFADVMPCLQQLAQLKKSYNINLLSYYSWEQNNVDIPQFYTSVFQPSALINLPLFAYNARFRRNFSTTVQTETPRYDILGYDITSWVIQMLQQQTDSPLQERIQAADYQGLQSDIQFRKSADEGGYENVALKVITK